MSGSVELDLWLHEYEEAALSDALKQRDMTVREHFQICASVLQHRLATLYLLL